MQQEEELAVIVPPKNFYFDNPNILRRLFSKKDD